MMHARSLGCLICLPLLAACGPNVSEVRSASYPPREENCSLEFLKLDNQTMSGQGPWEVIGQVILMEQGKQDPFAEERKAIVRPRACKMGGEAVAIMLNATSETLLSSGSTLSYAVLRKRTAQSNAPQQF
jgi:hypothetical protein